MNQNRNNNRRRGRGSNRGGPGGGAGIQGNRIDSRARGNAPQMLEKYRKLAHDASLNGDRVQTEYYLQFADHYFRVVADSRTQKDEQRPRRDDRETSSSYDPDGYESDERDDAVANDPDRETPRETARPPARGRSDREDREQGRQQGRPARDDAGDAGEDGFAEGERAVEGEAIDGTDNPFLRDEREGQSQRGARSGPRGRGRARPAEDAPATEESEPAAKRAPRERAPRARTQGEAPAEDRASFDPGLLPPSIPREEEPAPRPRTRRRPRSAEDEALEAAS